MNARAQPHNFIATGDLCTLGNNYVTDAVSSRRLAHALYATPACSASICPHGQLLQDPRAALCAIGRYRRVAPRDRLCLDATGYSAHSVSSQPASHVLNNLVH